MNHVFRWAVVAVSTIILTVVLASNAKADSLGLELAPTVQLSNVNGKYQASSVITPKGECQYGYRLSLKLHELKLNNTKHQINLATEQNQSDNVWGYLEGDKLKSEGEISSENNQPVSVMYEARPKADLPAGNYRGEVQYTITAKPAPEPVAEDIYNSWEYRDGDDVQAGVRGKNLFGIKSVELFDQSGKSIVSRTKEESMGDSGDGTSITFDFGNLSAGRYFATVYSISGKSYKVLKPLVVWPRGDCVSGNSEFNKCRVVLPQSNDTKFIPVVPSGKGKWRVVAGDTGDNSQFGEWYDYDKKHWANVVEVPKEKYQTSQSGTLTKSDYIRHWTYIPRYNYKVQRRDAVDRPMSPQGNNYSFAVDFTQNEFRKPSPTCSSENDHRDYLDGCHPLQPWATPPAFLQQDTLFDGIWLSDVTNVHGGNNVDEMYQAQHNSKQNEHWINSYEWGAMVYFAMSHYGVDGFTKLKYPQASCIASSRGDCWGIDVSVDSKYLLGTRANKPKPAFNAPWLTYYDTTESIAKFMNQCTFETCGGQALYELWGSQTINPWEATYCDGGISGNDWIARSRRLNRVKRIEDDNETQYNKTIWAWPVGGKNVVVSLLAAPQRLQPQLKAAQPNRISEQASSVKLETSQQVSSTETAKTSERPTTRSLDQQLSPAVRNRTEVTANHAVVDDAIPQVKRQRQAVTTGPVLRPNSAGGQTNLATGQSPVAGVLGTEQNFVKQGLTHASSLMTAE